MTRRPTPSIIDDVLTADVLPDRTALRGRLRWDYSQVAPVDRKAVEDAAVDILANGQRLQQSAVAIGERLQSVKRLLPHGKFGEWCATEFAMSQKTAENLMNVAREFGDKIETVSILTDSAMYMLAAPSTPPAARDQAIQEAQDTGKSPTKKRVSEIIAQHKPGPVPAPIPQPTAKEYGAAVQAATVDVLPPSEERGDPSRTLDRFVRQDAQDNAPDPSPRIRGYSVLDDIALRAAADLADAIDAAIDAQESFSVPDGRIPAAQRLIALYREAMATEDQYGALTGHFSDWLAPKRDLSAMIGQLEHLISVIEHPEVTPAAD